MRHYRHDAMTWNRKAGAHTEVCIRCNERPPATRKRRCKECLAEMEASRRERLNDAGDGRPCAVDGCDNPRYRIPSQYSSYCYEHHLRMRYKVRIKREYGLTPEQYEALMERASRACEACGSRHRLVVDHCHETGVVRGILCDECNRSLGNLHDDVDRVLALAAYLMTSRDVLAENTSDSQAPLSTTDEQARLGTGRTAHGQAEGH